VEVGIEVNGCLCADCAEDSVMSFQPSFVVQERPFPLVGSIFNVFEWGLFERGRAFPKHPGGSATKTIDD
jgi:hypothetical protein